jgi:hypothetical protein
LNLIILGASLNSLVRAIVSGRGRDSPKLVLDEGSKGRNNNWEFI